MTDREKIKAEIERLKETSLKCGAIGKNSRIVVLNEILSFIDSMPVEPHQELYNKLSNLRDDAFTNTTKESWEACLSEEHVSEELEKAAKIYATEGDEISSLYIIDEEVEAFKAGAKWHKEQMMKDTADAMIGLSYENKDDGYTHLIDVSRPLPVGNNKIAIIFKEK